MSIMDIINPWGALRRARLELEAVEYDFQRVDWETIRWMDRYDALKQENAVLRIRLKKAHFRDPKTGRLGKRGETFS